jgi:diguanylate cyclase (GGDEF)-like protein
MPHPAIPSLPGGERTDRTQRIRARRVEAILQQGVSVILASVAASAFLLVVALRNGTPPVAAGAWAVAAAIPIISGLYLRRAWSRSPDHYPAPVWRRVLVANALLSGAAIAEWYWAFAPWDNPLAIFLVGTVVVAHWMGVAVRLAASSVAFAAFSLGILVGPAATQIAQGGDYRTIGLLTLPLAAAVALVHADLRGQLIDRIIGQENLELLTAQQAVVLDTMAEAVLTVDRGRVGMGNAPFLELLGSTREGTIGRPIVEVLPELADPNVRCDGSPVPAMLARRDGTSAHLELRGRTVAGHVDHQVWICADVTERVHHEREMQTLASHDDLTGLLNRRALHDRLALQFAGNARPAGVLLIDLDGFKEVNDRFGHEAGDRVLSTLTARLRGGLAGMIIGRIGGDEFVVAVPRDDPHTVEQAAEIVCALCRTSVDIGFHSMRLSASVGGVLVTVGHDVSGILRLADAAMYRAKQAGGDRWVIATTEPSPLDEVDGLSPADDDEWRVDTLWDQVS